MSIRTLVSWSISLYLHLPPPFRSVHFHIEAFRWYIAVEAMLRCVNEILGVGWLPPQSSHTFDDISTSVFPRVLAIFIGSHILESV